MSDITHIETKTKTILHGQGATKERLAKGRVEKNVRSVTKGGIPDSYGHEEKLHCALDALYQGGYIEKDQYQAGYDLRALHFAYNTSSNEFDKGGKGHEGEFETEKDRAYEAYRKAIKSVSMCKRGLIESVCTQDSVPTYYAIITEIQRGLDELVDFFTKKHSRNLR